jgi:ATP-dependent phosphoenolpyruvate carboxykinase
LTPTATLDAHLRALGLRNLRAVHHDLSAARLTEEAILRGEAMLSASGAVVALTG